MALRQPSTATAVPSARSTKDAAGRRHRLQQSGIDILIIFVVVQIASIVFGLIAPDFFAYNSFANVQTALEAIPLLGIPALGVGVLMIAGEFDLSIGANYIFSSIIMAQLNSNGLNVWLSALIGLAIGSGIGLLNGLVTLKFRIPSFITTLGSMGIWTAATLFVHGASSQSFNPSSGFSSFTSGTIGVLPAEFVWFIVLAIAFWALLHQHRIGNHIYAVGGNKPVAVANGVRVERVKMLAFALAGACAALGGILAASQVGNIAPSSASDLALNAIAASVIGGLMLTGGRGTILGIVLGSILIYWIQDVLLLLAAPAFYLTAFVGILIIGAAAIYEQLRARRG
jgi:simple sugar transport system permease protein